MKEEEEEEEAVLNFVSDSRSGAGGVNDATLSQQNCDDR